MPQTLIFIYFIFATRCHRPLILKYKRFKPLGWKYLGISIFEKKKFFFLKNKRVFSYSNLTNVSWTLKVLDLLLFNETH